MPSTTATNYYIQTTFSGGEHSFPKTQTFVQSQCEHYRKIQSSKRKPIVRFLLLKPAIVDCCKLLLLRRACQWLKNCEPSRRIVWSKSPERSHTALPTSSFVLTALSVPLSDLRWERGDKHFLRDIGACSKSAKLS